MSCWPLLRSVVVLSVVSPLFVQAQERPPAGQQTLSLAGTLQGLQPGLLHVVNDGGEQWLVKAPTRTEDITYEASAHPSWLQPGMYVQFKGTFDQRGKSVKPVSQLTVITPHADTRIGAIPDTSLGVGAGDLFGEVKPVETNPKTQQPTTVALTVTGRLAGVENGVIRVTAGNAVVDAQLTSDAAIAVELSNYALARPGDKVSLSGWYLQKGQGYATRLLVRAAQPLGSPKKERVIVSPEERKKAFDALDDLSAGEDQPASGAKPADGDKPASGAEPKKE